MKYKVGDKVRVRKDLVVDRTYDNDCFFIDEMKEYRGRAATIMRVTHANHYKLDIDNKRNFWTNGMLEPIKEKQQRGQQTVEYNSKRYDVVEEVKYVCGMTKDYDKALFLREHKEQILDEVEREYLRNVIKPFRDKVEYIQRYIRANGKIFITISIKDEYPINFPNLTDTTMYRGMKPNKEYTAERLGL